MKKINKNGISLIVLIVTIIVIIILAAVVILTIQKNNPVESAKEAAFKEDIYNFKTELELYKAKASEKGEDVTKLYANKETDPSIKDIISSITRKYLNKLEVRDGKLAYIGKDKTEYILAKDMSLLPEDELLDDDILTELKPFITEWTVEAGDSITLPIEGTCNFTVDYGDGSEINQITNQNDENKTHTYQNSGTYKITIKGKCQKINFYPNTSKKKITKLVQWGNLGANVYCFSDCTNLEGEIPIPSKNSFKLVTNLEGLFYNCSKLTGSIPNNLFKGANRIESLGVYWGPGAFKNCSGLTGSIPKDLFKDTVNVKSFCYTFQNCSRLTGYIPEDLFENCNKIETLASQQGGIFTGCSGLTGSIPENLFKTCNKVTNYQSVFAGCKGLTGEIPSKLFSYSPDANNFTSTFEGCSSITSASDIFNGKNKTKNFNSTFYGCSSLERIDKDIFKNCSSAESFNKCFCQCTNLKNIPKGIFDDCAEVKNFNSTFYGCKSITELPEDLFKYNTKVTSFGEYWNGIFQDCCNLTTISEDLFKYNTEVTSFEYVFMNCSKLLNIPDFSYNTKINYVSNMFWNCSSMKGDASSLINNRNITGYSHCFYNCNQLDNYQQIPSGWK